MIISQYELLEARFLFQGTSGLPGATGSPGHKGMKVKFCMPIFV